MRPRRLVVVGDVLLDVDTVGSVERLCPYAPAPGVEVGTVDHFALDGDSTMMVLNNLATDR